MSGFLETLALDALTAIVGHDEVNNFLINRLVNSGQTRPHPWTTRYDYICWTGLTDRTYNSRLLRAKPYPEADATGTRRPPIDQVAALFRAPPVGQRVCPKSTCLFPAFAQYLTDGFIRTRISNDDPQTDRHRTTSNHEIDLSTLYGRTEAQTGVLRVTAPAAGQRGKLKSETLNGEEFPLKLYRADGTADQQFCDLAGNLILDEPLGIAHVGNKQTLFAVGGDRANATPQVAMINVLLLREHNRLAGKLETANPAWDDERVFQTARNILIVMFITIVVEEYINHINTSVFKFRADPSVAWHAKWNKPNWMTAEFSLLYRWHSLIPETFVWDGTPVSGGSLILDNTRLLQSGLADAFVTTSANHATMLGIGNTATFTVGFEQKAVNQARDNDIATYNDYRLAMKLDPAKSFDDVIGKTNDPAERARRASLSAELKRLYGKVENLEYYVGLFAEPREKNGPLPELILTMVAMDAFSQALTNPLLSEHVWGDVDNRKLAFTDFGIAEITATKKLKDMLVRNTPSAATTVADRFVGMTRQDWHRE